LIPTLRTERLTRRPITEADADAVSTLFADPELSRFYAHDLTRPAEVAAMIHRRLTYQGPNGTGDWLFVHDGAVIGMGHLRTSTELPGEVLECGFYLARRHHGQGLAREATEAILRHSHDTLAAPAVFALIHKENEPGLALATRLGFLTVGEGDHYGAPHHVLVSLPKRPQGLHHVEIWVPDLAATVRSWGWLLSELGYVEYQRWQNGVSWCLGQTYLVFEDSPDRHSDHDRRRSGLNHLALHAGTPERIEHLVKQATEHGWRLMFADRHPYAGGPDHYAAYLENADGYEVELVATSAPG
jgi:RimJ/RimL family protein N-acetyltransferase/catechol 2,3-dioxygenase-like lactoylglutathione lyase family enzyme